jgi:hypothetical protein
MASLDQLISQETAVQAALAQARPAVLPSGIQCGLRQCVGGVSNVCRAARGRLTRGRKCAVNREAEGLSTRLESFPRS